MERKIINSLLDERIFILKWQILYKMLFLSLPLSSKLRIVSGFGVKCRNSLECWRKHSRMRTFSRAKETASDSERVRKIVAYVDPEIMLYSKLFVLISLLYLFSIRRRHNSEAFRRIALCRRDLHCIHHKWRWWWCYWNSWHNKNLSFLFRFAAKSGRPSRERALVTR